MRSKIKALTPNLLLIVLLAAAQSANAQAGSDNDSYPDEPPRRPEYEKRALPDDTFTPSEEISEDFPVPFPVDI